jgi:hypothetical protein
MTPLNIIKQAVWKAIPEIKELKFGCEIEYMPTGRKDVFLNGSGTFWAVHVFALGAAQPEESIFYKILGRPITLADVLFILSDLHSFVCSPVGACSLLVETKEDKPRSFSWNLLNDNLDHQSQECLDLLASILK